MTPIDEQGALWMFEPSSSTWTQISPTNPKDLHPEARSYHCMTSDSTHIYVHAGCSASGRLADLWAFNVADRKWKQLAPAPGPPRGGASIAYVGDRKLVRMNGFDGTTEVGGSIDIYDCSTNEWTSMAFEPNGKSGPGARSVATLLPVQTMKGTSIITLFGESDPSSLGHQGAGKMLDDIRAFSLHDSTWEQVKPQAVEAPKPRGWFDAAVVSIGGKEGIVVVGGPDESNERLDDVWLVNLESGGRLLSDTMRSFNESRQQEDNG
jgi:hypothetical protein